jgi:hypothetical protein
MSEEKDIAQQIVLTCDTIFYRALRTRWVKKNAHNLVTSLLFDAFTLRYDSETGKIEEGVSLSSNLEKCSKLFKGGNDVASLTLRQIEDVSKAAGLDLYVHWNKLHHAEIRGLPCPKDKETEMQKVAGLLAKQCKLHLFN